MRYIIIMLVLSNWSSVIGMNFTEWSHEESFETGFMTGESQEEIPLNIWHCCHVQGFMYCPFHTSLMASCQSQTVIQDSPELIQAALDIEDLECGREGNAQLLCKKNPSLRRAEKECINILSRYNVPYRLKNKLRGILIELYQAFDWQPYDYRALVTALIEPYYIQYRQYAQGIDQFRQWAEKLHPSSSPSLQP